MTMMLWIMIGAIQSATVIAWGTCMGCLAD